MDSVAVAPTNDSEGSADSAECAIRPTGSERTSRAPLSLSLLRTGDRGIVLAVGSPGRVLTALERRLLELGFANGEHIEVIAEARPGRDPFVVRLGATTLALRRREADSIWVLPHAAADP